MLKSFTLCLFVLCVAFSLCAKEYRSASAIEVEQTIYELNNEESYGQARKVLNEFLAQTNLSPEDKFYGFIYASYIHKRLFNYESVLQCLDSAAAIVPDTKDPHFFDINEKCQRFFALFDTQDYLHASVLMNEIAPFVDEELSDEDRSIFYMQQGYISYLNEDYDTAEQQLFSSEKVMQESAPQHLPIVYVKLMELYAATGKDTLVNRCLEKSLSKAEEFGIVKYNMLTYEVRRNIAQQEQDFENYLKYDKLFEKAEKDYNAKNHLLEVAEIQKEHDLQLHQVKLDKIAAYNQRLMIILIISFIGIIILAFLIRKIYRLKLKEEKKSKALKNLDQLNKEIFSVISHDFKEPILSLDMMIKNIKKDEKIDREHLEELESEMIRSRETLNNLLSWAQSELNKKEVVFQRINVRNLCDTIIESLTNETNKKNITLQNKLPDDFSIKGGMASVEIALRNLISNAIKYSYQNGEVIIRHEGNTIQVVDEGIGLKDELKKTLFKGKVNSSYGTRGEIGFGLGLFITKALLEKNELCIAVANNSPQGTIFSILKQ